ncbi:hypothetical protein SDC9_188654 [bioreactor metagenome]|uniref:Uncharacterized protein n=1 Tax=bioreactor metagenome TaxID=1076179 RepID=A0A645I0Q6_9ZZZZ
MRLHDLTHVHQLAQQGSRAGWFGADDRITGFGGSQMVADRADTADTRGNVRHFEDHTAFTEFLKATEFIDVQVSVVHFTGIVQADGNFRVTFDTGNRFNGDLLCNHYSSS